MAIYQKNGIHLLDHLKAMIASGKYPPNSKLPSLRELAKEYSLSLGTVQRCIAHLEDNGVVTSCHGAGIFVRPPDPTFFGSGNLRIGLHLEQNPEVRGTYCSYVAKGIQDQIAKHEVMIEMGYRYITPPELLNASAARNQGLLLLGSHFDRVIPQAKVKCPVVGVEMALNHDGLVSTLSLDPFRAADLAVDYFRSRKISEVLICSPDFPLQRERAEIFRNRFQTVGRCREQYTNDHPAFECDDPKSGYLFTSGSSFQGYSADYRRRTGRFFAQDRIALAIDGKSYLLPGMEPADCILTDWVEVGHAALDEVVRRVRNPGTPARRIYFDCTLKTYDFNQRRYL